MGSQDNEPMTAEDWFMVGVLFATAIIFFGGFVAVTYPDLYSDVKIYEGDILTIETSVDSVLHINSSYLIKGDLYIHFKDVGLPVRVNITSAPPEAVKLKEDLFSSDTSPQYSYVIVQDSEVVKGYVDVMSSYRAPFEFNASQVYLENNVIPHQKGRRIWYVVIAGAIVVFVACTVMAVRTYAREVEKNAPSRR